MLFKLSLRNLSHSIRDYAVYFITLILGVMVFYLFNALDSQSVLAMVGSSSYEIIHQMMAFLYLMSFFVAFIMGFLVIYASRFLIRRRKRELGTYLLLGLPQDPEEAAKALEEAGHVVLNPATLPDGLDDVDYMRICMAMVDAADLAVFLPDYRESRGAMVEWAYCQRIGKDCALYLDMMGGKLR